MHSTWCRLIIPLYIRVCCLSFWLLPSSLHNFTWEKKKSFGKRSSWTESTLQRKTEVKFLHIGALERMCCILCPECTTMPGWVYSMPKTCYDVDSEKKISREKKSDSHYMSSTITFSCDAAAEPWENQYSSRWKQFTHVGLILWDRWERCNSFFS